MPYYITRVGQQDNNGWERASLTLQNTSLRLSAIPSRRAGRIRCQLAAPHQQCSVRRKTHPENADTSEHGTSEHQGIPYEPEDEPS